MSNIEECLNDSQTNVDYNHAAQTKIEEMKKRMSTPVNNIQITYKKETKEKKKCESLMDDLKKKKLVDADNLIHDLKEVRRVNSKYAVKNNLYTHGEKMINNLTVNNLRNHAVKFKQKNNLKVKGNIPSKVTSPIHTPMQKRQPILNNKVNIDNKLKNEYLKRAFASRQRAFASRQRLNNIDHKIKNFNNNGLPISHQLKYINNKQKYNNIVNRNLSKSSIKKKQ